MPAKKVAIVQSNYIPWKGYFDLIQSVDEFVFLDNVQFTRRDWRNRNIVKSPTGPRWLTIPVQTQGKYLQKISETKVADPEWCGKHWEIIKSCYKDAKFFGDYKSTFEELFLKKAPPLLLLSQINLLFIGAINKILNIQTRLRQSDEFPAVEGKNDRLIEICQGLKATHYLSGPSAQDYLDVDCFEKKGIHVEWMDYSGYKEYPQCHGSFVHEVSVLDLIFNVGPMSSQFLKTGRVN